MHIPFYRLLMTSMAAFLALALTGVVLPARAATVTVGYFTTYLPSEIEARIIGTIAKQYPRLGVTKVAYAGTDVAPAWIGLQRGDTDVMVEADMPNQQPLLEKSKAQASLVAKLYGHAGQGFFVPRFAVQGANAPAAGLKSIDQLPKYAKVFGSKLYDESPGWQSTKFNDMRLKAYGIHFTHLKLSDAALVAQVERNYARKQPIVFFFYHPHWLFKKLQLVKLKEPNKYHKGCFTNGDGRCPVPSFSAWVAARKDLKKRVPLFYKTLEHMTLSINELEGLMFKVDVRKTPIKVVARTWVQTHKNTVDAWVKEATAQ